VIVGAIALAGALYITYGLWLDPYGHTVAENVGDQALFEWNLAYGVYLVEHLSNPFFTTLMNAPHGVNLAANTTLTVDAVLFAPLTKVAGPQVSLVAISTLNLAGSAVAWYLFFGRWVVRSRVAAAVAGLFCGFAPGFVAHSNAHLNFGSGWLAPLILWRLCKLRDQGRLRWLRNGAALGVAVAVGFSIAAEGLFMTALAGGVFVIMWVLAPANRAALPRASAGLGTAAAVAGALLAYPLYLHFAGPETFGPTGFRQDAFSEDLTSFASFGHQTVAGLAGLTPTHRLSPNPVEETSFFGLPLVLLVLVGWVALRRRADPGRRALLHGVAVVGAVFMVISLGPHLRIGGSDTGIRMPYAALINLPLFDAALPARFALVLVGVVGVVLALLADELLTGRWRPATRAGRITALAGVLVPLLPLLPLPIAYGHRTTEPRFISAGTWQRYVPDGGVLSEIPLASNVSADGERWQAYTMARGGRQFRIPDGFFLGPDTPDERGVVRGRIGAPWHYLDATFRRAAMHGQAPKVTDQDRRTARADLAYWHVDALFLPDAITGPTGMLSQSAVEQTAVDLLGPPERVDDVLVWRVRPGVDPVAPAK
jgi:hypothetical protein